MASEQVTLKQVEVETTGDANQLPQPASARLKDRTEFSITLFVPESSDANVAFRFEYKEHGKAWTEAAQIQHKTSQPGDLEIVLEELNPTSTYEVRIVAVDLSHQKQDSKPSETAAVDTDVPGCTPSPTCFCCTIL